MCEAAHINIHRMIIEVTDMGTWEMRSGNDNWNQVNLIATKIVLEINEICINFIQHYVQEYILQFHPFHSFQ